MGVGMSGGKAIDKAFPAEQETEMFRVDNPDFKWWEQNPAEVTD